MWFDEFVFAEEGDLETIFGGFKYVDDIVGMCGK